MAGTRTQITELYVATFMRAPDAPGIDYWVASPLSIEEIAQSFFDQDETQALYGGTITDYNTFVQEIYNNMFNHGPDEAGEAYWVDELQSGRITPGNMILAIANGALGTDQDILDNKTEVGLAFADAGLSNYDDSIAIMSEITADDATVEAALAQIRIWESAGDTENFTTDVDHFDDALPGDDTFSGVVNGTDAVNTDTYQGFDFADGGIGDDTLHITSDITDTRTIGDAVTRSIETLHITQNADHTVSVDATNFDDHIRNLVVDGSAGAEGAIGVADLKAVLNNIELSVENSGAAVGVFYENDVVSSGDNSSAVTLTNSVAQSLFTVGIEIYTVHTGIGAQGLGIADPFNTTIIVDGGGDLTLAALNANHITLSGAQATIIYSNYSESNLDDGVDTIVSFESGTDKINVSEAITGAGGSTGEAISAGNASAFAYTPVEGDNYRTGIVPVNETHAYQDLNTKYLYIDVNQDNIFNIEFDMVIDMGVNVVPDDLIV